MPSTTDTRVLRLGFLSALGAYLIWGVSPLFFHALAEVPPFEVVAHRVVWSMVALAAALLWTGQWPQALAILRNPRAVLVFAGSALAITVNWVTFVYAVTTGHALQASLGYYVFPLVTVLLAAVVLKETFTRRQGLALGLVVAGVLALVIGLGVVPWVSLTLAFSFGCYGLLRKIAPAESFVGLFVETLLLLPLALGWIAWQEVQGVGVLSQGRWDLLTLLAVGTPIWTALPLFLFAVAARRLRLATVGLMQYLNPTSQFLIAVLVFRETFTVPHLIAFACIWSGVALYSWPRRRSVPT